MMSPTTVQWRTSKSAVVQTCCLSGLHSRQISHHLFDDQVLTTQETRGSISLNIVSMMENPTRIKLTCFPSSTTRLCFCFCLSFHCTSCSFLSSCNQNSFAPIGLMIDDALRLISLLFANSFFFTIIHRSNYLS